MWKEFLYRDIIMIETEYVRVLCLRVLTYIPENKDPRIDVK